MKMFKKNQVVYIKAEYANKMDNTTNHIVNTAIGYLCVDDDEIFSEIPESIVREEKPKLSKEDKKLAKEYQTLWDKYFY